MSRVTAAKPFKDWVRRQITGTRRRRRAGTRPRSLRRCNWIRDTAAAAAHLRLCGRHVLDAAPYNAAKHGFAVQGAHQPPNRKRR